MTSVVSELLVAIIKLATLQVRVGLLVAEVATLSVGQMLNLADDEPQSFDAEVDAAARAIKAKLLGGGDLGFLSMLRVNFPDDDIRAMAGAALKAARRTN